MKNICAHNQEPQQTPSTVSKKSKTPRAIIVKMLKDRKNILKREEKKESKWVLIGNYEGQNEVGLNIQSAKAKTVKNSISQLAINTSSPKWEWDKDISR